MESGKAGRAEGREGQCADLTCGQAGGSAPLMPSDRQSTTVIKTAGLVESWPWAISDLSCKMGTLMITPLGHYRIK